MAAGKTVQIDKIQTIGKYDLFSKLGQGSMGTVYKARDRETNRVVAVKIMSPETAGNDVLLKRFEQEFHAANVLDHPNIVRALDYCAAGPAPYLVMEFVDGEALCDKIDRQGALPEGQALLLIAQVCQALNVAHQSGIIHRDVKPDNILVSADGQAKLTDLGLIKGTQVDLELTKTGHGLGTPHYMAPEQFRDAKNVDVRSDIYSLGATLYAMVTGKVPFQSAGPLETWMKKVNNELVAPRVLVPALSEQVERVIRRAMAADPNQRQGSCQEFVNDLLGRDAAPGGPPSRGGSELDLWYLRDQDASSHPRTVLGTTAAVRQWLGDGSLDAGSTQVLAGKTMVGPFNPLASYPDFRDLANNEAPPPAAGEPRSRTEPGRLPPGWPPATAPADQPASAKDGPPNIASAPSPFIDAPPARSLMLQYLQMVLWVVVAGVVFLIANHYLFR